MLRKAILLNWLNERMYGNKYHCMYCISIQTLKITLSVSYMHFFGFSCPLSLASLIPAPFSAETFLNKNPSSKFLVLFLCAFNQSDRTDIYTLSLISCHPSKRKASCF